MYVYSHVQPGLQVLQSQLVGLVRAGIKLPGLPDLAETTGIMQVGRSVSGPEARQLGPACVEPGGL